MNRCDAPYKRAVHWLEERKLTLVIFSEPSLESVSIASGFIVGVKGVGETFFVCCLCFTILAETERFYDVIW